MATALELMDMFILSAFLMYALLTVTDSFCVFSYKIFTFPSNKLRDLGALAEVLFEFPSFVVFFAPF